jgi:hypothetical protein
VTVRERDSLKQDRVKITDLYSTLAKAFNWATNLDLSSSLCILKWSHTINV